MAFTWPHGTVDFRATVFVASQRFAPLSDWRRTSIVSAGRDERFAMVRLTTLPSTRRPSRNRMAGLEFLFGTFSMYMGIL